MYKQQVIRRIVLCCLLGLLYPFSLLAQSPEVAAHTDTNSIRIGEQIKLHLTATLSAAQFKDAGFKILFPVLPDSLDHFEVVSRATPDTVSQQDLKVIRQTYTLTSFDSGHWEIPPVKFEVITGNGVTDSLVTAPVGIDVTTVAVDTTKAFKPIKAIQTVPWNIWDYWLYIVIGAAAALLIVGLIWYFRRRPKKVPVVHTPTVTPYEVAQQALKMLKEEKLWQQGNIKQYYTRLTDILRVYFEHQFGIAALEQTSEELLQHIKPVTKLNQQRDKLRSILAIADLAKFAKLQPTADEHEDCMVKAEEILEWTRPKEEPVSTPEEVAGKKA
ncbi:DUF3290 domain-containing protein [Chitinophaga nivalis]|uniref:DUF3290 domain-containing protein n=1 Tax=Chitinophaga nivalis TaxID=2991709 RepID=A0ABT3IU92_9BACT|nr:DUF3290 domain-containing protein [Chitinophaga nivalis]MCW3462742.1 DUF3290 domain-containing protein [Chitinophaga nivalis]MCW3487567.1 DUF3290 domain-containing protein [Chitinophaga nivalis]